MQEVEYSARSDHLAPAHRCICVSTPAWQPSAAFTAPGLAPWDWPSFSQTQGSADLWECAAKPASYLTIPRCAGFFLGGGD